ncbi:MAG: alternative ribosome rescue aminoacyl-tRNA hydrolase ArfB [Termitinemataceae bacterium]|nr:MAG: alternative ribosome rescue aminoacyl-tRNA hydrolase ArfB [Termitinemataceae bacterium]
MDKEKVHQSILDSAVVSYCRSGGPGGQNVNKVNTKVTLHLNISDVKGLTERELLQLREKLKFRLSNNHECLIVVSDEERLQHTNEERAFSRIEALVISSGKLPKVRRPTKPTRASKEKRLSRKKINSQKKANRATPYPQ